ncbi:hypothetical protein C7N43_13050 [Sphingobacteriales bacterium UPWRP_1]|nr:hypothetical protein BVG80_14545 [Sphingobacteriales bacterium TSM_CSM]PSJ76618.1 hypothetical protein C7N43_13050 [Sphingobacteriales bacterium UPWRP_1]
MFKYFLLCVTFVYLYSFCTSPKPSAEKEQKDPIQLMENDKKTVIKVIHYQSGKTIEQTLSPKATDTVANLALYLLSAGDPLRLHLTDEQMNNLFATATGFELLFQPPLATAPQAEKLSKMLFLTEGVHANTAQIEDARFFFALSSNNQYIQSPYVADGEADKVVQLQQLLGATIK